jgi:hypothetical protein
VNPVVDALAEAWGAWQRDDGFPFSDDHCINGSRVTISALARLGVYARPLSVSFILFNAHVPPDVWQPPAHSLGVGPGAVKGADGWDGHLVVEGEGWTLDVSARQFHRPGRLISDGPWLCDENLPAEGPLLRVDEHNQVLYIARWPENNGWRTAGGWKRPHGAEVREIVARTTQVLADRGELYPPGGG